MSACDKCAYLRSLLAEQVQLVRELLNGVLVAGAVNGMLRHERLRAMAPPGDVEAERFVLGAALRTGAPIAPELFSEGHHYALAVAITTGGLAPELLYPEAVGYRRGLQRARCGRRALEGAMDTLLALRAQRGALAAAERAVAALRDGEGDGAARGVVELRTALRAMAGGAA